MLTIRLQRTGSKNNPDFRIVLAEKHRSATKKVVEIFGQYNPRTKSFHLSKKEQLLDWVKKNVELSPTVQNLLIRQNIIQGKKVKSWRPKVKEKKEEAQESKPAEAVKASEAEAQPNENPPGAESKKE